MRSFCTRRNNFTNKLVVFSSSGVYHSRNMNFDLMAVIGIGKSKLAGLHFGRNGFFFWKVLNFAHLQSIQWPRSGIDNDFVGVSMEFSLFTAIEWMCKSVKLHVSPSNKLVVLAYFQRQIHIPSKWCPNFGGLSMHSLSTFYHHIWPDSLAPLTSIHGKY